jgi:hypothetical protein
MIIREQYVHILARDGPDRSGFGGRNQGQRYADAALDGGRLAARHMILDNPPNQIAGRGAFSSGEHLDLPEDRLRKLHCSPHHDHCPMSGSLVELHTADRAFAQMT